MNILYLSHCVPYPPNKGEKIRAFHELTHLAETNRVHLACLAKSSAELEDAESLWDRCVSVQAETVRPRWGMARAGMRFAAGASLTASFYSSSTLRRRVAALAECARFDAAVVYSAPMIRYVPPGLPALLDLVDVDSEKWLEYSRLRSCGFFYAAEGNRLRQQETVSINRAACSFLTTRREVEIFKQFSPHTRVECLENGVDFNFFDPAITPDEPALSGRRFLVFTGAMNYFPNADGVRWFADRVLPALRPHIPGLELFIVGRDPTPAVRALAQRPGIQVTGTVVDVRPYLKASLAVIAPLRIARGVQNKVLEALAMGKRVMASQAVCKTLEPVPPGVIACASEKDYIRETIAAFESEGAQCPSIRSNSQRRFSWGHNMQVLSDELCRLPEHSRLQEKPKLKWVRVGS